MLMLLFMSNTLGWFSIFFIAISTGSIKCLESVIKSLCSIISRESTALLKSYLKFHKLPDH